MKELYMKNFNEDKIFSLEYDKETLRDMVLDKQEEIERLNNIIKEIEEYCKYKYDLNELYLKIQKLKRSDKE